MKRLPESNFRKKYKGKHRYICQLKGEEFYPFFGQYACIYCGLNMRFDPYEGSLFKLLSKKEQRECRKCQ